MVIMLYKFLVDAALVISFYGQLNSIVLGNHYISTTMSEDTDKILIDPHSPQSMVGEVQQQQEKRMPDATSPRELLEHGN